MNNKPFKCCVKSDDDISKPRNRAQKRGFEILFLRLTQYRMGE